MTARSLRSVVLAAVAALALVGALAACTKSTPGTVETSTTTQTITKSPSTGLTGPTNTSPVTEKKVSSCPYLSTDSAVLNGGMRIDKIATLIQSGKVVGCRFYPLEHPNGQCPSSCLAGEHLPPGNIPAVEVLASPYATARAAYNAFVVLAEKGTGIEQYVFAPGNTGLCYKTTVWDKDNGMDVACTFSKGTKVVVIRTVVVGSTLNVVELAKAVYPKI